VARSALDRVDDALGSQLERIVAAHHLRRLTRHGWAHALRPPTNDLWCAGDPPPREGNAVEILVDGAEALPRLQSDIAGAAESVLLAGWAFEPSFRLTPDGPLLGELLADKAEDVSVRMLAWAGAPLPLFHPSRREVRAIRDGFVRGTMIRMELDARERPMHCHHEKLAVIDGRIAYVGGIDLTSLAGNRLDSSDHPARGSIGWHDAAARIEGPLVADVHDHLAFRWREVTGDALGEPVRQHAAGEVTAQLVRTIPNGVYDGLPNGDYRILEAYMRALRSAEQLVYLENQFLWSSEVTEILAAKLRQPPTDEFRVVVVLPAHPNSGDDDTRGQLGVLVASDADERLLACTLYQPGRADQVYVHAKVAIVDDRWLAIGSANLNSHSFYNDTEVCLITCDEALIRSTRQRLWQEHLGRDEIAGAPHEIVDRGWAEAAKDPAYHRLELLPHVSRRSRGFLGPLNGLLVDG
jgi:phosphatidylserine/phosphatidylglycerophosphate/cardiolipin synthase-like enzyme